MNQKDLIEEIGHIRSLMEKSSKFMSISGMSGVLIGSYALIGAYFVHSILQGSPNYDSNSQISDDIVLQLTIIAGLVLIASLFTGVIMARQKAKRVGQSIWNLTSKSLAKAMTVPLVAGGIFTIVLVSRGEYSLVSAVMLVFYGLSLYGAGAFSFHELRWLGILDIILGLLALCLPDYGLWFWAFGFGFLHIIYGLIVHQRYEK